MLCQSPHLAYIPEVSLASVCIFLYNLHEDELIKRQISTLNVNRVKTYVNITVDIIWILWTSNFMLVQLLALRYWRNLNEAVLYIRTMYMLITCMMKTRYVSYERQLLLIIILDKSVWTESSANYYLIQIASLSCTHIFPNSNVIRYRTK